LQVFLLDWSFYAFVVRSELFLDLCICRSFFVFSRLAGLQAFSLDWSFYAFVVRSALFLDLCICRSFCAFSGLAGGGLPTQAAQSLGIIVFTSGNQGRFLEFSFLFFLAWLLSLSLPLPVASAIQQVQI